MTTKIGKTLHLSAGQWKTLDGLMQGALQSTNDDSVARVCRIVMIVCGESGTVRGRPR